MLRAEFAFVKKNRTEKSAREEKNSRSIAAFQRGKFILGIVFLRLKTLKKTNMMKAHII